MSGRRKFDGRHISSDRNYQMQQTNWFDISIQGVKADIAFYIQNMPLPSIGVDVINIGYGNTDAKQAGKATFDGGSFTVNDAIAKDVELEMLDWFKQVYDPKSGKMGWVDQYKRDMTVIQYGPDGTYERTWKYEGVFPTNMNFGEMSNESPGKKDIQVQFSYDVAYRVD